LANVAIGLFLFFVVVVAPQSLPIRLKDPALILSSADSLIRFMVLPLLGGVASPCWRGAGRSLPAYPCQKQLISRLTLFAAIGFLLLVPQLRFQDIGAPPPPETLFNQPFVIVKKQAKEFISQASSATKFRATTPVSPEVVRIYLQSIQVVLLALLSAFCFFCTSW
jgi:hypothetical protein